VGTFGYMAPEQLHGAATPATDIFGLGATLVALAGRIEPERIARRGLKMDLERHLPDMEPGLRALLLRMTDPDPEERPASATEALEELDRLRARAVARVPAPRPSAALRTMSEDDVLTDDGSIPQPIFMLLLVALFAIGAAGSAVFFVADVVLAPLVFAVVRAFRPGPRRGELAATEASVRGSLRGTRDGFRALMRRGMRGRRSLPPRRS
jgi:hypothetical protein